MRGVRGKQEGGKPGKRKNMISFYLLGAGKRRGKGRFEKKGIDTREKGLSLFFQENFAQEKGNSPE